MDIYQKRKVYKPFITTGYLRSRNSSYYLLIKAQHTEGVIYGEKDDRSSITTKKLKMKKTTDKRRSPISFNK